MKYRRRGKGPTSNMTAAMDLAAVIALLLLMTAVFAGLRMRLRSHLLEPTIQESPINYNTSSALNGNTNRDME